MSETSAGGSERGERPLPPLRLPRCLLDPAAPLPAADGDGLVAAGRGAGDAPPGDPD